MDMIRRISWRRAALPAFLLVSMALLLYRSDVVAEGVREALVLCARSVVPSLFPMFVAVTLAVRCGLGRLLSPGWSALLLGLVGGYPMGAKTVAELLRDGCITELQAQKLLCCCNNCGGAFILGVVGRGVFGSSRIGWMLWAIHAAAALLFAAMLLPAAAPAPPRGAAKCDFVGAVRSGAAAMVNLCGFVVFFLAILRLLAQLTGLSHPLLLGFVELTTGCAALSATKEGFVAAAMLVSWGGVSVHAQTASVLSDTGLRLWPYLLCKVAQSLLSGAGAWLVATLFL